MDVAQIVNVFRCCILTWDFLPVVLPAFLIAGAIPVFVPYGQVMRHLGFGAARIKSYAVSCVSGFIVSMCSCNVVPVAESIYKQGAGIGPTVTFLFAGPAINLVTMVWVFQVVGVKMGLWRALAVPICAVGTGLIMQVLFRREECQRQHDRAQNGTDAAAALAAAGGPQPRHVLLFFGLLLAILLVGSPGVPGVVRLPALAVLGLILALRLPHWFDEDDIREWIRQTGRFLAKVLPILIPAIFLIALVQNMAFGAIIRHVRPLLGQNTLKSSYAAAALSSLLYFPMLTEVALAKVLLKDSIIAVGPALSLLVNGPGVSLPGAILLVRIFGWRKALVYELLEIFFGGAIGYLFGRLYGDYVCPCQLDTAGTILEQPSSLYAALILAACLLLAWTRFAHTAKRRRAATIGPCTAEAEAFREPGDGQ